MSDNYGWSLYGAPWLQPVAIRRKSPVRRRGENKPEPLPSVATGCLGRSMVRRGRDLPRWSAGSARRASPALANSLANTKETACKQAFSRRSRKPLPGASLGRGFESLPLRLSRVASGAHPLSDAATNGLHNRCTQSTEDGDESLSAPSTGDDRASASPRRRSPPEMRYEHDHMNAVTRLVTFVDLRERVGDAHLMSVSARHEAELLDGRLVLLLDDRGWTERVVTASWGGALPEEQPDIWATTSIEDIEETARTVVGPDEPFEGSSREDAETDHWTYLSDVLRRYGVVVDPLDLKRLPHDVVLSERLLSRIGDTPPGRPEGG